MRKYVPLFLVLLVAGSASAAELPIPRSDAALTACAATRSTPPTLKDALDAETKKLVEVWYRQRDGNKRRMWCDFSCSDACWQQWFNCRTAGNPSEYCCAEWRACICYNFCCPDEPCPTGCPG